VENGSSYGAWTLSTDPHQEFQELCALSTTGELTAEEWTRLTEHLAHCEPCRRAKRNYERLIAATIPALAVESEADREDESAPGVWSIDNAEDGLMESLRGEPIPTNGHSSVRPVSNHWKHALGYAAAAMILASFSFSAYRFGIIRGHTPDAAATPTRSPESNTPPRPDRPATPVAPATGNNQAHEDDRTAELRVQARRVQEEMTGLKNQLAQLEKDLAERNADLDHSVEDRADLNRQLAEARADALSLQARLSLIGDQASQDAAQSLALKAQISDLNAAIEEKDKAIAQDRELLQKDRDIRNLIGARNLYIAEIYDVGQSGDTQKPFGRVFYTKDKSLIFYGYDLDQQPGVKKAGAFQAWGGRGADRQHAVSLGLLYKDDANQKRWVLKFNDAKTISQIDAVFVTVEPEGGSAKPSGKPLLFTYLRLDPNHP
jgi:hypothetical protein